MSAVLAVNRKSRIPSEETDILAGRVNINSLECSIGLVIPQLYGARAQRINKRLQVYETALTLKTGMENTSERIRASELARRLGCTRGAITLAIRRGRIPASTVERDGHAVWLDEASATEAMSVYRGRRIKHHSVVRREVAAEIIRLLTAPRQGARGAP